MDEFLKSLFLFSIFVVVVFVKEIVGRQREKEKIRSRKMYDDYDG